MALVLLMLMFLPNHAPSPSESGSVSSTELPNLSELAKKNRNACGPVAVWYLLNRLGHKADRTDLVASARLSDDGATIGRLLEMLAEHNCPATAVNTDKSRLALLPAPSILIVDKGTHCVVYDGFDEKSQLAKVFETTNNEVQFIKLDQLRKSWTGEAIICDRPYPSRIALCAMAVIVISLILMPAALVVVRRERANRRGRAGFTLIELLVGLGIVGVLIALVLPAIQQARESSRAAGCRSNLHQIGIAMHSYEASYRVFPPAVAWAPAGEPLGESIAAPGSIDRVSLGIATAVQPDRVHANWAISLLPFLDEEPLYRIFDRSVPVADLRNEVVRSTELALMKCPTDATNGSDNHFQRAGLAEIDRGYARGNYGINGGTNRRCLMRLSSRKINCKDGVLVDGSNLQVDTSQVWGNGVAGVNRAMRRSEFIGGLSTLVLVEEIRSGVHPLDRRGVWTLGFPGSSVTVCHGLYGNNGPNLGADAIQGCSETVDYVGDLEARGMPCLKSATDRRFEISERATARSMHLNGVNLLMADGSVHFVVNAIDKRIWHNLHKRDHTGPIEF